MLRTSMWSHLPLIPESSRAGPPILTDSLPSLLPGHIPSSGLAAADVVRAMMSTVKGQKSQSLFGASAERISFRLVS